MRRGGPRGLAGASLRVRAAFPRRHAGRGSSQGRGLPPEVGFGVRPEGPGPGGVRAAACARLALRRGQLWGSAPSHSEARGWDHGALRRSRLIRGRGGARSGGRSRLLGGLCKRASCEGRGGAFSHPGWGGKWPRGKRLAASGASATRGRWPSRAGVSPSALEEWLLTSGSALSPWGAGGKGSSLDP